MPARMNAFARDWMNRWKGRIDTLNVRGGREREAGNGNENGGSKSGARPVSRFGLSAFRPSTFPADVSLRFLALDKKLASGFWLARRLPAPLPTPPKLRPKSARVPRLGFGAPKMMSIITVHNFS